MARIQGKLFASKAFFSFIIIILSTNCSTPKEILKAGSYSLVSKNKTGTLEISSDGEYRLEIKKGLYYRYSNGFWLVEDKEVLLNSEIQEKLCLVKKDILLNSDTTYIKVSDMDSIPIDSRIIVNDSVFFTPEKGRLILTNSWHKIDVLVYNYISKLTDTTNIYNFSNRHHGIDIRCFNTLNYPNYVLFDSVKINHRGNTIQFYHDSLEKLRFKRNI